MLREAVGRGLSRSRLQVVQIAVLLLIVGETLTHVVEHLDRELLRLHMGEVFVQPVGI